MAASEVPWFKRSRREWALRDTGHNPARILMSRYADEKGLNSDGNPALWSDVGKIDSYNDAEKMLSLLNAASGPKDEGTLYGAGGDLEAVWEDYEIHVKDGPHVVLRVTALGALDLGRKLMVVGNE